jgi:hypothetical protein
MVMKNFLSISAILLLTSLSVFAQKTNDAIAKQIKSLKADKTITLTYDADSKASKLFARAENFSDAEAKKAGIQAMNFGLAFFYVGKTLNTPPETITLTFMVLIKKPVFAGNHNWINSPSRSDALDFGDARYVSKPGENMEYLNFRISRTDLAKVAASADAKFKLGNFEFTFTPAQLTMLKNFLAVSDIH